MKFYSFVKSCNGKTFETSAMGRSIIVILNTKPHYISDSLDAQAVWWDLITKGKDIEIEAEGIRAENLRTDVSKCHLSAERRRLKLVIWDALVASNYVHLVVCILINSKMMQIPGYFLLHCRRSSVFAFLVSTSLMEGNLIYKIQ
jgi:hypothetical protein